MNGNPADPLGRQRLVQEPRQIGIGWAIGHETPELQGVES
jgi:hypothetical protein